MRLFGNKKKDILRRENVDKKLLTNENAPFQIVEAFRNLRTNIIYSSPEEGCSVVGVLSATAGAGKSFVFANLALSLSQMIDKKVLLIDGDMRCPMVHQIFKSDYKNGLSTYLAGVENDVEKVTVRIPDTSLDVIFSGVIPPNPIELLASRRMEELVAKLKEKYDYILIDLPPVHEVADAIAVSSLVSGFIFVARSGYSDANDVAEAIETVTAKGTKIFGFVLSDADRRNKNGKNGYYSHGYGSYYEAASKNRNS